jgi:hypothetical protein
LHHNDAYALLHHCTQALSLTVQCSTVSILFYIYFRSCNLYRWENYQSYFALFCVFCFKAIWRQIQSLGLSHAYTTDNVIRQQVRQLMALGFLPRDQVRPTFERLKVAASPSLAGLFNYFQQQWFINVSLDMWNVFDVDIRTNNSCEGWHIRFNSMVNKHHPNLWFLLRFMLEEQTSTDMTRNQIAAGQSNTVRVVSKYKKLQQRITTLRTRFNAGTIDTMAFLTGISFNLGGR